MFSPSTTLQPSTGTLQLFPLSKPFVSGDVIDVVANGSSSGGLRLHRQRRLSVGSRRAASTCRRMHPRVVRSLMEEQAPAVFVEAAKKPVSVKAELTVLPTVGGLFAHVGVDAGLDGIADILGKSFLLELVSSELDSETGVEKKMVQAYARRTKVRIDKVTYEANFTVPAEFGKIGAVQVENEHHKEMFLKEIVLTIDYDDTTALIVPAGSWVHSKFDNPQKRVFFTSESYLPSQTPEGLQRLREKELETKRGDGTGERKMFERIYDYDTYNDLGNPDQKELKRHVLGGPNEIPYPRRCRTGRPRTKKDPKSEKRSNTVYVPRDEAFSEVKQVSFSAKTLRSVVHALVPSIETALVDTKLGFPYFTAIDTLFDEGVPLPNRDLLTMMRTAIPRLIKLVERGADHVLQFETPEMIDRDKFSWFRDEEFSRQTLAGLNPMSIQLLNEFPIVSKLDPKTYGPPESAITAELIEREMNGVMTTKEAIERKRLFIIDYHDVFLPYVHKVREIEGTTLYGSRALFFLTNEGTLQPIAIELVRPASPAKPQWKQVFTPSYDATGAWLWKLAKVHFNAHDSGFHQLVTHWLRTHCCVEPYIIAANRQLSEMHPIYRLLHPHFRYTMEINALARESLINAGGIIETAFSPRKFAIEISAVAYGKLWRFDKEALPADLIQRGMAVEDSNAEHGLRLTLEDYPFANDGLLIWSSIKEWVTDYVSHYYKDDNEVSQDQELQAWWTEVRTKGHADKKDEPWWPTVDTQGNLIHVLTTIIWVTSGHHAAVNFGQYHYAGYFPNRPTIARTNMPNEDPTKEDYEKFLKKPEKALLRTLPTQIQATVVMAVLDILSTHSPDEEYIGGEPETAWKSEPVINAAFERFCGRMKEIEGIIDGRNVDPKLMNRCGAGIVPYELLKPYSKPGVTGMGIPNSISI